MYIALVSDPSPQGALLKNDQEEVGSLRPVASRPYLACDGNSATEVLLGQQQRSLYELSLTAVRRQLEQSRQLRSSCSSITIGVPATTPTGHISIVYLWQSNWRNNYFWYTKTQ